MPPSVLRPSCLSSRTTTSSGCSTARESRWRTSVCPRSTVLSWRRITGESGSASARTSTSRATPTGLWLSYELIAVFGVAEKPAGENAQKIYDHLQAKLADPEYTPRSLFAAFDVEVLCTTDTLEHHAALQAEGWGGRVRPTFRPDAVPDLSTAGWHHNIDLLSQASGIDVVDYGSFLDALQERRSYFKEMGALATDHSATPYTERLPGRKWRGSSPVPSGEGPAVKTPPGSRPTCSSRWRT